MSSYAPLQHAIWEDDDFRDLAPESKLVYLLLISHRKLTRCGVLDLMPTRWAKATGLSNADVAVCLSELVQTRFVLIDNSTEELAVRTKVKNDQPGTWTQVKAVWRAWEQCESRVLREWLVRSFPDVCWEHEEKAPAPCERPCDTPLDTPCHTPSDGATDGPARTTAPSTSHPAPSPGTNQQFTDDNKTGFNPTDELSTTRERLKAVRR